MDTLKKTACDVIDKAADELNTISQNIWKQPELNFQEHNAHDVLTKFLENQGFDVERNYKLDTAFRATIGDRSQGPHVAVLCEYDALPDIGHACGHNLIAEAGIAAAIGIKAAMESSDKSLGKLTVLGTPAEEGGGGKCRLIDAGAFEDFDVAMMTHPAPIDGVLATNMIAVEMMKVTYKGHASHAAAYPWLGVNALDAAVLCYQTVSCMRQQMKPTWRVHGIITNGGVKPNIIPEKAVLEYCIRAPNRRELKMLRDKVVGCFESAAKGTGCSVDYDLEQSYLNMVNNVALAEVFKGNAQLIGLDFEKYSTTELPLASTDMGNVSYIVPSIHPFFYIGTDAVNHSRGFTTAAGSPEAQSYTLIQGKALAMTALDVFCDKELLKTIKDEFDNDPQRKD